MIVTNIGLGDLGADRDAIIKAAKSADAHDFIMRLPDGYDTKLGEDGAGSQDQTIQRLYQKLVESWGAGQLGKR